MLQHNLIYEIICNNPQCYWGINSLEIETGCIENTIREIGCHACCEGNLVCRGQWTQACGLGGTGGRGCVLCPLLHASSVTCKGLALFLFHAQFFNTYL